ncbi:hypothetical protein ACP275_12G087600 [Erythranthe tilingii]
MASLKLTLFALFILVATGVSAKTCETSLECVDYPCRNTVAKCSNGLCQCNVDARVEKAALPGCPIPNRCLEDEDCQARCVFGICMRNQKHN